MAEGIDNLDGFGERLHPIEFDLDASDNIRSMAVLEGCSPEELVRRALLYYDNQLKLTRQGWEGPIYRRQTPEENKGRLGRWLGLGSIDMIKCNLLAEAPPTED